MIPDPSVYDGVNILWDNRTVRTAEVTFGEIRYKPGGFVGPRIQQNYQLVLLHSGSCRVTIDGTAHELAPGRVALFLPGHDEYFCFSTRGETHHTWCHASPSLVPGFLRQQLRSTLFSLPCSDTFKHIHAAAFKLRPPLGKLAGSVVNHLGVSLFIEYLNMAQEQAGHTRHDAAVSSAMRFIEENYGDPDCLAGAVHAAGLSQNAMIYKFRRELKITPARYLWKLRTEKGVAMLSETGLGIAEIAYRCGFKNPYHFSRLVKLMQGRAPRAIRRKAWAGK